MQKWEYLFATFYAGVLWANGVKKTDVKLPNFLAEVGQQGWELVSATETDGGFALFFKRPI